MNYIKELNAFHNRIVFEPLSSSAVALWFALMHFNNLCGWRREFNVAASRLQSHAGLKSTSFKRARSELSAKGLITVVSQGANRAAQYHMVSQQTDFSKATPDDTPAKTAPASTEFATETSIPEPEATSDLAPDVNRADTQALNSDCTTGPLNKQEETTPNKTSLSADNSVHPTTQFYTDNFTSPTPFIHDEILKWCDATNDDLVHHAMTLALERGKTHWNYVKGILLAWDAKQITTVEAAMQEAETFRDEQRQRRLHRFTSSTRPEVIPDWFKTVKQQRQENESKTIFDQLRAEGPVESEEDLKAMIQSL